VTKGSDGQEGVLELIGPTLLLSLWCLSHTLALSSINNTLASGIGLLGEEVAVQLVRRLLQSVLKSTGVCIGLGLSSIIK